MRRFLLGLVVCCATAFGVVPASAEVVTNVVVPVDGVVIGGCTETVVLTGDLHLIFRVTTDGAGGIHVGAHSNAQNLGGVGLSSGLNYRAAAVQNTEINVPGPPPAEITDILNLRLVAPGTGNNLYVSSRTHTTVNAAGEVSVSFSNFEAVCQ